MLLRKMFRDIKNNKMQFISIFLMAFLSLFVYSGIGSEWYSFQTEIDDYYEKHNLADIWLYGDDFQESDVNTLLKVDGITGTERRLHLTGTADLEGDPELEITLADTTDISTCAVYQGEAFDPERDGIWINRKFAEARGLGIGDSLRMNLDGISISQEILGIIDNPEYVYACASFDSIAAAENIGIVYGGMHLLPSTDMMVYNEIAATSSTADYDALEKKIEAVLSDEYHVFLSRDSHLSYQQFNNEILQNKAIGDIFPFVFIAVALLSILTAMTRIVNNQRVQIGALKSLGFKNRRILWHYISYGLLSASTGAIGGLLTGPLLLAPMFIAMQGSVYSLPELTTKLLPNAVLMTLVTIAVCTLVTYLACRKILKEVPAQALRPKAPAAAKQLRIEKTPFWHGAGFDFQWNFRDTLRNKVRSLMAIVGITGCMALLICGFGLIDSLTYINTWKYDELTGFRSKIQLDEYLSVSDLPYPGEAIQEESIQIRANGRKKTSGITVLDDDSVLLRFTNPAIQYYNPPHNGISISYKISKSLDIAVGDEVEWHLYGSSDWITSTVKSIYRDPVSQGGIVYKEYFEAEGLHYQPTAFLTSANMNTVDDQYATWSTDELKASINNTMESMYEIIYIMVLAAVVMAVVVLYNLGILSFTEKQREFATLRVLGFKTQKIRKLMLTQNLVMSLVGLLPGWFLGRMIIGVICSSLGDEFDMLSVVSLRTTIISIAITMVTSVIVNILFSRKIKEIDMVSALKGVE